MSTGPRVLVSHEALYNHDSDELAAEIRDRASDVDLAVASDVDETVDLLPETDVLVTLDLTEAMLEASENLSWIQSTASGVDIYDLDAVRERGVALTNAAGVHADPIAEQVIGYMLAFERRFKTAFRQQRERGFRRFEGGELNGKTVGILGLGAIGSRVAELVQAFDLHVVGTRGNPEQGHESVDELFGPGATTRVAGQVDYLVVACPLTDETEGLVGEREFASMQSDAVLVNIARGPIIDQDALLYALRKGRIAGAALDVFEEEPLPQDSRLWAMDNVIVTPHMAGSTPRYFERVADLFADNYERFVDEGVNGLTNRAL